MTRFTSILMLFITIRLFDDVISTPIFKGISFKRAFDFSFIPMERNPISYIRERWSPFGVFGVRRTIAKRDLNSVKKNPDGITSVTVLPPGHVATPYLQMTPRPPSPVVETPETPLIPENNYGTVFKGMYPKKYPLPPTFIFMTTPKPIEIKPLAPGLHTDISLAPLTYDYLNSVHRPLEPSPASTVVVEKEIPPAPSETPPVPVDEAAVEENSIFPKSKLVLHFSNIFLKLVSQFFANARYGLSQLVASRAT